MNDIQKEPVRANLNDEKELMERLQAIYTQAGKDIAEKIRFHDAKISILLKDVENLDEEQLSLLQAQIYQREFQKQLKRQIDDIMKNINAEQYDSIDDFMKKSYENGFIGTLYDIQSQGVPLIFPIDQQEVLDAVKMNSKISKKLYKHLGKDVKFLKRRIASDVARGIATSLPYRDIARNIERVSKIGFNRAMRIARTEGHNMRMQGVERAQHKAKEKGADIVKQWDATLDGRTRDSHAAIDGEIRELDEPFSNGMMRPGDSNASAAEIVNCRCVLLQRARWALGADELKTLQERAEFFGLDKAKNFEEYRRKYLKIVENPFNYGIISGGRITDPFSDEAEKFAEMYYEEIRSFSTDVQKIAKNLNKKESEIRRIKNYLFVEESLFDVDDGEYRRFDPDCAIAQSWQRLMLGDNIQHHDIILIEHELYEMKIKSENPSMNHFEAHRIASEKYNYPKEVEKYYGNLKKHRKK